MDPKAALKAHLKANAIKPSAFARDIDYDKSNFHRLLNNKRAWPSLDLALRIDRATKGKIPMSAWAEARSTVAS